MSMKDGTCSECGSTDVRKFASPETGSGRTITGYKVDPDRDDDIDQYICCDCGHIAAFGSDALREYARENLVSISQRG